MIKTPTEEQVIEKIKAELELLSEQINKVQRKIDKTPVSTGLIKELVKAREALVAQRNAKINLLNTIA